MFQIDLDLFDYPFLETYNTKLNPPPIMAIVALRDQDQFDYPRERFTDPTLSSHPLDVIVHFKELERRRTNNSSLDTDDLYMETYLPLMDSVTAKGLLWEVR